MKNGFDKVKLWVKWRLFPGLDLATRCRYRHVSRFLASGPIDTLDAGCGNGALSYAAYLHGNRVIGVTKDPNQVRAARALFSAVGTDPKRLSFEVCDLYDLPKLDRSFDQIICSETLEHIRQDDLVIRNFYEVLRPGGVLHLCCPFALHPEHHLGRVDGPEDGGHVRDGYTLASYRTLLEPAGFQLVCKIGLGSQRLTQLDRFLRNIRNRTGDLAALPFFLITRRLQQLDALNPPVPYSLYVQAVKPLPAAKEPGASAA
ncbi:MAG: class I SAM-dependent methyltransferase [Acidobacteria bacterium]|nr:class I SAM-dependent methyltransferase [Acidobacteriota bacterium]MBI3657907.1 class I SAM-dependent methyltransferase [Acidobacteriota bacterium]